MQRLDVTRLSRRFISSSTLSFASGRSLRVLPRSLCAFFFFAPLDREESLADKYQFSLGRKRGWLRNRVLDPNFIRREGRHLSTREGGVYALTRYSYYAFWFRKWRSRWGQLSFRLRACSGLRESCINRKHAGRRHYVLKLHVYKISLFANVYKI